MSQPTLNSSFSGINFAGVNRGRLSYSSLRNSGDTSINLQIKEEILSTPNVYTLANDGAGERGSIVANDPARNFWMRQECTPTRRERLSQPTLAIGDHYPGRSQQRYSQPCLTVGREPVQVLRSPIQQKRFGSPAVKTKQRDRLIQLDFGISRYRTLKDFPATSNKFNRDRFSIPELETSNDLRLIAGTPKQRFSLDSSLNSDAARSRLLPIASSPISEQQQQVKPSDKVRLPVDTFENIIRTSAGPVLGVGELKREKLVPSLPPTTKTGLPANRERMSVPEIRNSSLRRLLDSPIKQRHSLAGIPRQALLPTIELPEVISGKSTKNVLEKMSVPGEKEPPRTTSDPPEAQDEPRHIQRHYSYTYDVVDSHNVPLSSKFNFSLLSRKKYLESNFDKNEQIVTTVLETEIPMILSSPKYTKRTRVYSANDMPKWMKKCLENENSRKDAAIEEEIKVNGAPEDPRRVLANLRNGISKESHLHTAEVKLVPHSKTPRDSSETTYVATESLKSVDRKVEAFVDTKESYTGFFDDSDSEDSTSI
ncbi:uncharacterized protein LOC105696924 [Orussus abietinus]|uniref:uncharacterized protein LOC105696924 n=1 Tax=Orussus abietinus TaxID=222816 RepID=UPI000626C20E|nr:uncharacterized protein LOC105696924 [Orussus abietinus]